MGSEFMFKNYRNEKDADGTAGGRPPENLIRQLSVYSLTFDEFQNTMDEIGSGKDFGSMNMDELLKNIWNAEELQAMVSTPQEGSFSSANFLQKQGSLTLPRTLSVKTVDEVWRNMSKEFANGSSSNVCKQPTLGEVTLEEFLFRAGVVREEAKLAANPANTSGIFVDLSFPVSNQNLGFEFQQKPTSNTGLMGGNLLENSTQIALEPCNLSLNINEVGSLQQNFLMNAAQQEGKVGISDHIVSRNFVGSNGVQGRGMGMVNMGAGAVTVAIGSPAVPSEGIGKSHGDASYVAPVPYAFNGSFRGRKSAALEKVVERRQKRMIKNRESAARSRARKQAYTMELEAEVAKLKEENKELLEKQAELIQIQKNQVMEMVNQHHGVKRRCLRRTQTGIW